MTPHTPESPQGATTRPGRAEPGFVPSAGRDPLRLRSSAPHQLGRSRRLLARADDWLWRHDRAITRAMWAFVIAAALYFLHGALR